MSLLIVDHFPEYFLVQAAQVHPGPILYRPRAPMEALAPFFPETGILLLNSHLSVDKNLLEKMPRLRVIIRAGVGMDHIDEEEAARRGVAVHNCQGANADAVGEMTMGMLLDLRRKIHRADAQVRNFSWQREANRGQELTGTTVGLIGYGDTGKAVAKRLQGFGCRVLAFDKYASVPADDPFAQPATLEMIYKEAKVISLHIPLNEETRNWVNKDFFDGLRWPIYFLNLSRGPIVNLADLKEAIDTGKVVAAGLDVLPNEKLDKLDQTERALYTNLFARKNILFTPHIGGWTDVSRSNIEARVLSYIERYA